MTNPLRPSAISDAWREFWFGPEPMYTLGLFRIAFGSLVVAWALSLLPDLYEFFGVDGVSRHGDVGRYPWSIFEIWTSDTVLLIGWIVLMLAGIALTIGWHSRIAAILVFVLVLSFDRRNPAIFNSGDMLVRIEALLIALSPCGTALSLDQPKDGTILVGAGAGALADSADAVPAFADLPCDGACQAFRHHMAGRHGSVLRAAPMGHVLLPVPDFVKTNALMMNVATWGTLVVESAIPILVWNRRLRPWVLAAGVLLHAGILVTMAVGFFTPAMFVLYIVFIPPDTAERLVDKLRRSGQEHEGVSPETNGQSLLSVPIGTLPAWGGVPSRK